MSEYPKIINGVQCNGAPPALIDNYGGNLLLLGSSACVWSDYDEARKLLSGRHYSLMAVNMAAMGLRHLIMDNKEHFQHWVSLHPQHFYLRSQYSIDMAARHTCPQGPEIDPCGKYGADFVWDIPTDGTSGLFAARIACLMGYKRIILCGVSMDGQRRFFDHPASEVTWFAEDHLEISWKQQIESPEFARRVRSMSGRTKEWLGAPNEEWLNG